MNTTPFESSQLTIGELNDVIKKLGGYKMALRFLRGDVIIKERFPVRKTIRIGTGLVSARDFRIALKYSRYGCEINDATNDILEQPAFTANAKGCEIDLVFIRISELDLGEFGFYNEKHKITRKDIYKRACELGLSLCPAEVGAQLRLQYPEQELGEEIFIGMSPITDSKGCSRIFCVERYGAGAYSLQAPPSGTPDRHLVNYWGHYNSRLAFVRPRT